MKNLFKTFLLALVFLINTSAFISPPPPTTTVLSLANMSKPALINTIQTMVFPSNQDLPAYEDLDKFITDGMGNQFYPYAPTSCLSPAIQAVQIGGTIHLGFGNFPSNSRDMLYVGEFEYAGGQNIVRHAVHGEEVHGGIQLPVSSVQHHILMVTSYCINCQNPPSSFNTQCSSNFEIIIIEKHIL